MLKFHQHDIVIISNFLLYAFEEFHKNERIDLYLEIRLK